MSEGQRMIDLTEAIARAYVKNLKVTKEEKRAGIQLQIMNLVCGTKSDNCYKCVKAIEPRVEDKAFFCNTGACPGDSRIWGIQRGLCAGLCVCSVEAWQNTNVVMDMSGTIDEGDIDAIVSDTVQLLAAKYGNTFKPTKAEIQTIIQGKKDQLIDQIYTTAQIICLEGTGLTLRNVNQDIALNGVMKALAEASATSIRKSVGEAIAQLKPFVEKTVSKTFAFLWQFRLFWIILGCLIGVLILVRVILAFVRRR